MMLSTLLSVSPAPAGMIPFFDTIKADPESEPRTRGDDPPMFQFAFERTL